MLSDNTIFTIDVSKQYPTKILNFNAMTFEEKYIIKLTGDIHDIATDKLTTMHGFEKADIDFHLRAIQNIIYARITIQNENK